MNETIVSTNSQLRWVVAGVLCTLLAAAVFYVALRLQTTHRLEQVVATLQAEQNEQAKAITMHLEVSTQRLDALERTVYGDVWPKLAALPLTGPVRPSRFELWQRNRDKTIGARLDRLERWRLEHVRHDQNQESVK